MYTATVGVDQDTRPINDLHLFTHLIDTSPERTVCLATVAGHFHRPDPLRTTGDPDRTDCRFCLERYARFLDPTHVPDLEPRPGDWYRGRGVEDGSEYVGMVTDRFRPVTFDGEDRGSHIGPAWMYHLAYVDGHGPDFEVTVR